MIGVVGAVGAVGVLCYIFKVLSALKVLAQNFSKDLIYGMMEGSLPT